MAVQPSQLRNSLGQGVTCAWDAVAEAELRLCLLQRANTEGLTGHSPGCVVFVLLPLCRGLCVGRDLSGPRAAVPWALWSRCSSTAPAPVLLPAGQWELQGCQDFCSGTSQAFRYLKSQRALLHPIKECQVIPLCS